MTSDVYSLRFTIFVPVRNEELFIATTLNQLRKQDYPKDLYEVVVVDGMSTDRTREIVENYANANPELRLSIFDNPKFLSSAARNIAVKHGTGDYFLLIDGHVHVGNDSLLSDHAEAIQRTGAKVLGRPQPLNPPDISDFQQAVSVARASKLAHSGESFIYSDYEGWVSPISVATCYHKSVFEDCGWFDESFDAAEDYEFNYRVEKAGYQCLISSRFAVSYYPRDNISALFKQLTRYGYGRALFFAKHPDRISLENFVPSAFLLALVGLPVLGLFSEIFALMFWVFMVIYLGAQVFNSIHINSKSRSNYYFYVPAIVLCVHSGLGYGFIKGVFSSLSKK